MGRKEKSNVDQKTAWEAQKLFWNQYNITIMVPELLEMKKVPNGIFEVNAEVYLKITKTGSLYGVKIENKNVSVLYASF